MLLSVYATHECEIDTFTCSVKQSLVIESWLMGRWCPYCTWHLSDCANLSTTEGLVTYFQNLPISWQRRKVYSSISHGHSCPSCWLYVTCVYCHKAVSHKPNTITVGSRQSGHYCRKVWKTHCIPISMNIWLMKVLVWPVAIYGYESRTLRQNEETRLDAFEAKGR